MLQDHKPPIHPRSQRSPRPHLPVSKPLIWSILLIVAVIIINLVRLSVWLISGIWGNEEVMSSQPIGAFIHMSALAAWPNAVVIQTDQGFLPLKRAVAISTGTPLVLEMRGSGRRYVCDQPRTLCVETSEEGFKSQKEAAKEGGNP